jgi:hypothetical protein
MGKVVTKVATSSDSASHRRHTPGRIDSGHHRAQYFRISLRKDSNATTWAPADEVVHGQFVQDAHDLLRVLSSSFPT